MKPAAAAGARRVQAALGLDYQALEFDAGAGAAADAAAAIGCAAAEIAKSLIFRAEPSGRAAPAIVSGDKRVDERSVRADADFVREKTGFAIGDVPPLGHAEPLMTLIDESLSAFETIWAAAGTPNAVFCLTPADLLRLTDGAKAAIAR